MRPPRTGLRFCPIGTADPLRLGPFAATGHDWPAEAAPTSGSIQPYDMQVIARHLSPTAHRCAEANHDGDPLDLYEEGERFWLVDERWGMAEINMLRGQWRSWLLPEPKIDPVRCDELSVIWPLAQLLRGRGLHLVPAVSAVRDGWSVLILGSSRLDAELLAMIDANYRVIGQRWTAIRVEEGRLALLQMPGRVERSSGPRLAGPAGRSDFFRGDASWADLTSEHRGSRQTHAFCDAVLSIAPGRGPAPKSATCHHRRRWRCFDKAGRSSSCTPMDARPYCQASSPVTADAPKHSFRATPAKCLRCSTNCTPAPEPRWRSGLNLKKPLKSRASR